MSNNSIPSISRALTVAATILLSGTAAAQLHESINVEGKYVPDVIRIDRINTFPKALRQDLVSEPLEYERSGVATAFSPSLLTMPATGWRANRHISDTPGYVELGVGSWLNSTLSAGYRFVDNSSTLFGVRLQHNSTSLWKPKLSEMYADVKQERYDESLGLYASHVFKGHGRLDAALDWHFGHFNYYGFHNWPGISSFEAPSSAPTQTLNDVALRLDWRSVLTPDTRLAYHASGRLRHFGYRDMDVRHPLYLESIKGTRETNLGLEGGVRMPWGNGSSIGLDANLDLVLLSGTKTIDFSELPEPISVNNYGMLTLTPYYRFTHGLLDVKLGADIDVAIKAGEPGNRYSAIHVAPDVRFALQTGQVGLYLNVLGGSQLNTLSRLHELDYYSMPMAVTTRPTYTPIDAAFGVNLGPFAGFSIGLEGRYRSSKNVPLGGWYMGWLNTSFADNSLFTPAIPSDAVPLYSFDAQGLDIHGFSLSGRLEYSHGDLFSVSAQGTIQKQDGKTGFFNGYDRPKATALFKVSARPVNPLRVNVGYEIRAKRAIYTQAFAKLGTGGALVAGEQYSLHKVALDNLSLLGASASWNFTDNFSVWLQADNILNRKVDVLPDTKCQGIAFLAGLKWLF